MMKLKKRKKNTRMHGRKMGTHGWGARKKRKKSGHRGGTGMAGTGKRSDQLKTLILKKYGHDYFGKQGVTSKATSKDKRNRINVGQIQENYKPGEIELKDYKVLGEGEIKDKFVIKCEGASASAVEKVKKAGGEIVVREKKGKVKVSGDEKERKTKIKKVKSSGGNASANGVGSSRVGTKQGKEKGKVINEVKSGEVDGESDEKGEKGEESSEKVKPNKEENPNNKKESEK